MSLSILSLRDVFPEKFSGLNSITNDAIAAMIQINDTYNSGNYIISDGNSLADELGETYIKQGDNYRIFQRTTDSSGNAYWTEVTNPDQLLATSVDLYFLKNNSETQGKDLSDISEDNFVQIYSVNTLDTNKLIDTSYYADTAQRLAAVLYSLCAYNKKIMELQIGDIEAVNNEQIEVNRITALLTTIQNNLTTFDQTVSSSTSENHYTATVMPDILAFFIQRGLIDTSTSVGNLNETTVEYLKNVLLGPGGNTSDVSQFNSVECFKCWTEFLSVVRHAGSGEGEGGSNNVLNNDTATIKANLNYGWLDGVDVEYDPYASFYWRKASELTNNPKDAMTGIGDHWVFDPRLRDTSGNLISTSGTVIEDNQSADSYAYFSGFGAMDINNYYPEDSYQVYDPQGDVYSTGSNMGDESGSTQSYIQYDVRFYGTDAPGSKEDFMNGIAASLGRNFANDINFIPTNWITTKNGVTTFSNTFWEYIDPGTQNIGISWDEPYTGSNKLWGAAGNHNNYWDNKEYTRFVITDGNPDPETDYSSNFGIMNIGSDCRGDNNQGCTGDDFWGVSVPFISNMGIYTEKSGALSFVLTGPLYVTAESVDMNADQFALWSDTIRIYLDQVTNDNSLRSSEMQMSLQFSQQDLNTATSLMRSVYKLQTETTSNIR